MHKHTFYLLLAPLICALLLTGCGTGQSRRELEEAIEAERARTVTLTAALDEMTEEEAILTEQLYDTLENNDVIRVLLEEEIDERNTVRANYQEVMAQNNELSAALSESYKLQYQLGETIPHVVIPPVYPSLLSAITEEEAIAMRASELQEAIDAEKKQLLALQELLMTLDRLWALSAEEQSQYRNILDLLRQQYTLYRTMEEDPDSAFSDPSVQRINERRMSVVEEALRAIGYDTGGTDNYDIQRKKLAAHIGEMEERLTQYEKLLADKSGKHWKTFHEDIVE